MAVIIYAKYGIPKIRKFKLGKCNVFIRVPMPTKKRQKMRPLSVFGTTLPYPIVVANVPAKKNALW